MEVDLVISMIMVSVSLINKDILQVLIILIESSPEGEGGGGSFVDGKNWLLLSNKSFLAYRY